MIQWLLRMWRRRLRRIDMNILWPTCKRMAPDLDRAKAAFAAHAFNDHAWCDLSEAEIISIIEGLQ